MCKRHHRSPRRSLIKMVQIDTLNLDVIKVTIKDKPGLHYHRQPHIDNLREAFSALRKNALQEREVRQIRTFIETRNSTRRLKQCFAIWRKNTRERALNAMKQQQQQQHERNQSNEEKIELLVEAIAERQKQQQKDNETIKKVKSAPPSSITNKSSIIQTRTLSGNKAKDISTIVTKSRMQAQKRIIEEQRNKLEEQRRLIEVMKLKELDDEAKKTCKDTMTMARQALGQCDQRTRRSILHLMREQGCR